MDNSKKKGSRFILAVIILLIILFVAIEFYVRESQEFSPTSVTRFLLNMLQLIVVIMAVILLFVLGRNLLKLYFERKKKLAGSHFKTKLVAFFMLLSFIPTVLLFLFASDLISRNISRWFETPFDKILDDSKILADGLYSNTEEITYHYALQLSRSITRQKFIQIENRSQLREFAREKLNEYKLDEIGIYLDDEELFTFLNPSLPLQEYHAIQTNMVKRAHLGEDFNIREPMGNGEMIRRGVSFNIPQLGDVLVSTGKFIPQSYTQRVNSISRYIQRYSLLMTQKKPVRTFYGMILLFITLLIVFAASWLGLHLAKGITVPIEKLAQATRDLSDGNLDVRVEDPASDELGILIESFNQMISNLKDNREHLARNTGELENRKQYIEAILNNITTGVISLDAGGMVTTINPSAREMLGLGEKNPVGKNYQALLGDGRYAEILESMDWGMKNRHRLTDKEINIISNGQTVTAALTLSPLKQVDGGFSGMIVVLDNLTQLIQAQKMAAWKEVAQRVAHEIKNPLTPIQLSAERIIKNMDKNDPSAQIVIEEGARTIIQETRAIKSLVDEFSNFARMPKVILRPADIRPVIDQVVSLFRGVFANIDIDEETSADVPPILQIDPEQIKRVFSNIFDNAVEAMNKKGRIVIRTFPESSQGKVTIEIADTGPGIAVEDKAKLFLPYFSTKKKGTGLGLAIVSQIIRDHNGSITVENNQPSGAKFIIQLPA